jgi:hypothetical protein
MKKLLLALASIGLIPYPMLGQHNNRSEIGIIKDSDGYTNIRSAPQISSKVIGRSNQNDFVYFIKSDSPWWKLTTRYGEGVSIDPPPPPEQNGYIHSSRIVPIKELSISQIQGLYGQEWKKEKRDIKLGNVDIAMFNADRIGHGGPQKIPDSNSAYLEIRIQGKKPIRKYYPDIEGLGGPAGVYVRYVPVPLMPDLRFFVKDGDYDGRTIIVTKDGRVADLDGGGFLIYQHFLISRTGADCCGEPLIWNLKVWKEVYDLRNDASIDIGINPQFSYFIASRNLYLKVDANESAALFLRLNEQGKFVRDLDPPPMEEEMKLLSEDIWQ